MKQFTVEKGLAEQLSPAFREKFEEFMPLWVRSIVPYYKEAIEQKVDLLQLSNYLPVPGAPFELYEKDGIGYYLLTDSRGMRTLAFNCNHHYIKCNWRECFLESYPEYDSYSHRSIEDWIAYYRYMGRIHNTEEEYCCIAQWADNYFKELTGDNNVVFSLSDTTMLYFSPIGRAHIEHWCMLS